MMDQARIHVQGGKNTRCHIGALSLPFRVQPSFYLKVLAIFIAALAALAI